MSNALDDLIAKVEAGEADTLDMDSVFDPRELPSRFLAMDAYGGSLDATKALHESALCSIDPQYGYLVGPQYARIMHPSDGIVCDATADNPARAWILAILRAMKELNL